MRIQDLYQPIMEGQAVQGLFDQYGGKVMPFGDLPKEAQLSILEYTQARSPEMVKAAQYGLVNIPMEALTDHIMAHNDELKDDFDSFEQYHEWYMTKNKIRQHSQVRPVALSPYDDETLQDGWHRLHTYYHNGLKTVPAIMFV
jgi:hypothetical protein